MPHNPLLSMSDEDFAKELPPEKVEAPEVVIEADDTNKQEVPVVEEEKAADPVQSDPAKDDANKADDADDGESDKDDTNPDLDAKPAKSDEPAKEADKSNEEAKPEAGASVVGSEKDEPAKQKDVNFETSYKDIMAPFKANGKMIELKSPEEARQLMQMGANYTRKMQELQPMRKLAAMAQANGIDEAKFSFLIDLDKKDPEAIKKLIKESGIDPLDIDTTIEPAYREGSHTVTDNEIAFRTEVEELSSNPTGKETISIFNEWDQTSKDLLWQHPEVMSIIHGQRETGMFTKISDEMDRLKLLGKLSPTTPFLEAYKIVGDQLAEAGAFNDLSAEDPTKTGNAPVADKPAAEPVTTRVAKPKAPVENGDKADAASPSRASPGKAKVAVNYLSMSDEEFSKIESFKV